jgi:hypothetical protein
MVSDKQAVLKTLYYADLFNFPQTKEEIEKFLIKKIDKRKVLEILNNSPEIKKSNNFYFLKSGEKNVKARKIREKESLLKIQKAKNIVFFLSKIPSVLFIGISGSVAVKNAKKEDDIDLFVITEDKTIWVTRFLMVVLLKLLGAYRAKKDKKIKNKFCLNMLVTEKSMSFEKDKRNIYTAREICQLLPIFQRNNAYRKFLLKNGWLKKFLPNSMPVLLDENKKLNNNKKTILGKPLKVFNSVLRDIQLKKIKKNLTRETVSNNFIAFHPKDIMDTILIKYNNYPGVKSTRGY